MSEGSDVPTTLERQIVAMDKGCDLGKARVPAPSRTLRPGSGDSVKARQGSSRACAQPCKRGIPGVHSLAGRVMRATILPRRTGPSLRG
jgi:hypothetical protein